MIQKHCQRPSLLSLKILKKIEKGVLDASANFFEQYEEDLNKPKRKGGGKQAAQTRRPWTSKEESEIKVLF